MCSGASSGSQTKKRLSRETRLSCVGVQAGVVCDLTSLVSVLVWPVRITTETKTLLVLVGLWRLFEIMKVQRSQCWSWLEETYWLEFWHCVSSNECFWKKQDNGVFFTPLNYPIGANGCRGEGGGAVLWYLFIFNWWWSFNLDYTSINKCI